MNKSEETKENKVELKPGEVVFFASAARFQLGNWKKEQRGASGIISQPEEFIEFSSGLLVLDGNTPAGKAKIKFVRDSDSFKNGRIKEFATLEEAHFAVHDHDRAKAVTVVSSSDVTSHAYNEGNIQSIRTGGE